jgi:hypothetical protein
VRVVVFHASYGCDTGCCGHVVAVDGDEGQHYFDHAYDETPREFAERLVREECGEAHVADLDWENSEIYDGGSC